MNKYTRFNHSVSAQAVNRVIHRLIDEVAFTWLQRNWKQKKDGTFHKAVNTSLNSYIESIIEEVKQNIFQDYGKRINIRVWQGYHDADVGHEKVIFFVDATYKVVDISGESSHSVGYAKNELYVNRAKKKMTDETIANYKRDVFPLRQPEEVEEALLKREEIASKIAALKEQELKLSREFGYEYLEK